MSWSTKVFKVLQLNFPDDELVLVPTEESVQGHEMYAIQINGVTYPKLVWPTDDDKEFWAPDLDTHTRSFAEEFIASLHYEINILLKRWELSEDESVITDALTGEPIELQTLIIPTFF